MSVLDARLDARIDSRLEPRTVPRSRRVDLALTFGVFAALFAATVPLLRVVDSGSWVLGVLGVSAIVLAAGYAARWFRLPGIAVSLIEIATWVALVTALFNRGTALLWIIPTFDTFALVPVMVQAAIEDVALGAAPLDPGPALSFLIVASVGVLAIMIDHVVLTARMPLLAAIGLVAISLIPSIAVPGDVDIAAFTFLAISILYLLGVDTRARQRVALAPPGDDEPYGRPAGTASAAAFGIGTIAVIVALVASPLLPAPLARVGGSGAGLGANTIDPSLELGDDLRQPGAVEVLQMRGTGDTAPYLRITTLSEFDGAVWEPDQGTAEPLNETGPDLGRVGVDGGIDVVEDRSTVDIVNLSSRWAPVPYPAIDVSGLDGEWASRSDNHTVIAEAGSVQDQDYEVITARAEPTLEQMRARQAGGAVDETYELPDEMPAIIADTAEEVTAETRTDYDALVALQSWFRGGTFGYSLDAPVEDGFDGSGVDAIADFLEVRRGYCVHYASAFAVMARSLGMPSRIVVGYLPGTSTGTTTDEEIVYTVESTQLHSWPEVHFEGIGWVPFEPTNSLGTPTNYASSIPTTPNSAPSGAPSAVTPTATPTPTTTTGGSPAEDRDPDAGGSAESAASANPWPGIGMTMGLVLLLVAPGVFREVRRRRLLSAARRGEATAAWLYVQELAIDLSIPVPAAESPRAFGARLALQRGADPAAADTLVSAIERASYADEAGAVGGERLADAVVIVGSGLLETVSPSRRLIARVFPRSLAIRPGSAYAGLLPPPMREQPV